MDKEKLSIPVNVVEQEDFVAGFGNKELLITGVTLIAGIIIGILVYVCSANVIYALGSGIALLTITVTLIKRDRFDECIIDKMRFVKLYIKAQKQYVYSYYNIYEGGNDSGNTGTAKNSK